MGNDEEFDKGLGEGKGRDHAYGYINVWPPGPIDPMLDPEEYTCPRCGTILAADVSLVEMRNGVQKFFCKKCGRRVKEKD